MKEVGFIFDLDGVVVNTTEYHYLSWKNLADSLGFTFTHEHNERFKGVSREKCLEQLLILAQTEVSQNEFNTMLLEKNADYIQYIKNMNETELLPDVPRILNFLKEGNFPIGLGSASKNARLILERVNLSHYFNVIVDGSDVLETKPNPEVFFKAAKGLKIEPNKCVVFEDAIFGIQAANSAGMVSIGIGDSKVLANANYNFNDFTEIDDYFLKKLMQNACLM